MSVWVNVWVAQPARCAGKMALAVTSSAHSHLSGCIDDFDNPKGYGRSPDAAARTARRSDMPKATAQICARNTSVRRRDERERLSRVNATTLERIVRAAGCEPVFDDLIDCYTTGRLLLFRAGRRAAHEVDDFAIVHQRLLLENVDGLPRSELTSGTLVLEFRP